MFMSLYDPNNTIVGNQQLMNTNGLELSTGSICTWSKKYCIGKGEAEEPISVSPTISYKVTSIDVTSIDIKPEAVSHEDLLEESLNTFCWKKPDFIWSTT